MVSKTHKHKSTTLNKLLIISQMLKKEEKRHKEEGRKKKEEDPITNSKLPTSRYQFPLTTSPLPIRNTRYEHGWSTFRQALSRSANSQFRSFWTNLFSCRYSPAGPPSMCSQTTAPSQQHFHSSQNRLPLI